MTARTLRWAQTAAAAATLVLAVWLGAIGPDDVELDGGWRTPIIAFELARTPEDLAFLRGPAAAQARRAMDAMHRVDAVFPFAYASLLALVLLGRGRQRLAAWLGAAVCAVAVASDLVENSVLVQLTAALDHDAPVAALLPTLFVATWAKWGAIGVAAGLLGVLELARRRALGGLVLLVPLVTVIAFATGMPSMGEAMALAVAGLFLGLLVHTVVLWCHLLSDRPAA